MKDELGRKIMKECLRSRRKSYSYLTDNNEENKEAQGNKSVSQKKNLNWKIVRNVFEATKLVNKINQLEKKS